MAEHGVGDVKRSAGLPGLGLRAKADCRYDIVSLGEVMLRLDPGEGRIRSARQFRVWEGGGEYNVARGLRRCFGLRAAAVTAVVRNDVGLLLEDLMLQGGVDTALVRWLPFDGIGRAARNGLNFTERGFGVRGAVGCSDRGHSAASQLSPGDVDWEHLFGALGVRWFHTGGIFAALSESTGDVVVEAARVAKKHGTVVSYDLNYRPSLWSAYGGLERCREVNRAIAPYLDVILGNEEDFTACLGLEVEGVDEKLLALDVRGFERMIARAVATYPNFKAVAATLRAVKSATVNDWGAIAWCDGAFHVATERRDLEILDRVGGGDSFASGFIYGLMELGDVAQAVEYGAAHGALAMTTPGDTSMASLAEVEKLVRGGGSRVER
jgi:2-dehydro-3-deoxygluconokinase